MDEAQVGFAGAILILNDGGLRRAGGGGFLEEEATESEPWVWARMAAQHNTSVEKTPET